MMTTTRRGFLEALAGAFAGAVLLEKAAAKTVVPADPPVNWAWGAWGDDFQVGKIEHLQEPGEYLLYEGVANRDLHLRSILICFNDSAHLSTLKTLLGESPFGPNCVVEFFLNERAYFRGPLHFCMGGWGIQASSISKGKALNIVVPANMSMTVKGYLHERLEEPIMIQTEFSGIFGEMQ
jgi:hypothetical protein